MKKALAIIYGANLCRLKEVIMKFKKSTNYLAILPQLNISIRNEFIVVRWLYWALELSSN